jgi:hypothetical protein
LRAIGLDDEINRQALGRLCLGRAMGTSIPPARTRPTDLFPMLPPITPYSNFSLPA